MSEIRLQKFLADAGVASRRKCEEMIASGIVKVNGIVVTEPGTKVDGSKDISLNDIPVRSGTKKVYILLNKPVGYISSAKDQFSRKTVVDLVDIKERVYPVGRLDYDTSGLIILTNDGEFANILMHPRHEIDKTYRAVIKGMLNEKQIEMLRCGLDIGGYITAPAGVRIIKAEDRESIIEITIHEGKNRQVRRMFEAAGHVVLRLKRVAIGQVTIGGLEEGKWRNLSKREIDMLKGENVSYGASK
jgi:23S rRNA pseudouridine2605 synthase